VLKGKDCGWGSIKERVERGWSEMFGVGSMEEAAEE
jgi:hypothetical protein